MAAAAAKRAKTAQAGLTAEEKSEQVLSQGQLATAVAKAGVTANPKASALVPTLVVLNQAPLKPSQGTIDAGVATSVKDYMKELIPYVQERLLAIMKRRDSTFACTLAEAKPVVISKDASKAFKNFREPWVMSNCLDSLTSTQQYEASGNIFWLDILSTQFGEHVLTDAEVTWRQLEEGMALWGEDAFISSSEDERYRRYIFQITYPPRWQACLTLKV